MRNLFLTLWMVACVANAFAQKPEHNGARLAPGLDPERIGRSTLLIHVSDSTAFRSWLKRHPDIDARAVAANIFHVLPRDRNSALSLVKCPLAIFIDRADRKAHPETLLGDFDFTLNTVTAAHSHFPEFTGEGLIISIKEKPFDTTDIDLKGRVAYGDEFDEPSTLHATFIASIAAGGGNTSPDATGVARASGLTTSDFERLLPDEDLVAKGISVQNHSYGVGVENYYGIESSAYDRAVNETPHLVHVFSSGNSGTDTPSSGAYAGVERYANLTGQFKVSKNTISVGTADRSGAVVSRSSRGPAYDGRIKPELIAFGDAGSSEAAAVVSGAVLLIQDSYMSTHGVLPDAALVKAVLVNTADDSGRRHVDFETGFGNLDVLGAIRTIVEERTFSGRVSQGEEKVVRINVPPGQRELKVSVAWNDPAADPFRPKALVNDLDLTLSNVSSTDEWQPWVLDASPSFESLSREATRGRDSLNNVEQITIDDPAGGEYEIHITGYSVPAGAQDFHIAYGWESGFEWTGPTGGKAFQSGGIQRLRWVWKGGPQEARIEFRAAGMDKWGAIADVDLSARFYEWTVPDTSGLFQVRMSFLGEEFESVEFPISEPLRVRVGFNCENRLMLYWKSVPAADAYVVYNLGEKYMEPFLATTDTTVVLPKSGTFSRYFSVVPVFGDHPGASDKTIDYESQAVSCYFVAFVPRSYYVTDSALFDVTLGTTYLVRSLSLERFDGNEFRTLLTMTPEDTQMTLGDAAPVGGFNTYRLMLTTLDGAVAYSDTVEVLFLNASDIYIYPNPVVAGDQFSIVVGNQGEATIELFDYQGRLVRTTADFGPDKIINTAGLHKGIYLVRVVDENGSVYFSRLMIV